ncbi:S8 family peptidase [Motilibacter sp. E257]|uniref:S8 family peptidase n=1 Tax=Motilibacter deserti TaxID=2714956 RepID=A0ABX0GZD5_9ACTN|nr:S8 family peptidase [Motilibacter deserti]
MGACATLGVALATSGTALAASPAQPEGSVVVPRGAEPIAGSYIVVLKDGTSVAPSTSLQNAEAVADKHDAPRAHTFTRALRGFSTHVSAKAARQLAADPRVAYVEQDTVVSVADTQAPAVWGLDRIDQRNRPLSSSYTYNTGAANVTAYVIDTGIRTSHAQFGGRASIGYDAIGDGRNGQDCNGHGTHVAGTVGGSTYGVAKQVKLVAVRVLDCSGNGSNSGVIAGVNWVTANAAKPAVANMSLGGSASSALDAAVRNSINAGVTYALAAGNENVNACTTSPARTAEAITVGATTSSDARASFSNYGTCLDVFAPGNGIQSAYYTSDTATASLSGTSMASPHVAGAAALYLSANPTASPQAVRDAIVSAATPGIVAGAGTGSPTALLYTASFGPAATAPAPTPTPTPAYADGTLLNLTSTGEVYVIAGGAPVYVSTWDAVGGFRAYTDISQAAFDALPQKPADGTLVASSSGEVFVFAGGAPIYVTDFNAIGGFRSYTRVDNYALVNTAATGRLSHVSYVPADGTVLKAGPNGQTYVVQGGVARAAAASGGTVVDPAAIARAGQASPYDHLRAG